MGPIGKDIIGTRGLQPFFSVANADDVTIDAPKNRKGDALRTWVVRSLSGFQKEALVRSAKTGRTWRLVSDEGPYLNGHDAAPCPLAFLSTGMAASYLSEIIALAEQRGVELRKVRLIQNNYYTMRGSMPKRTMVGGSEPIELEVEVDCDLDDAALNGLLMDVVHASPLNGLMRGQLENLFKLSKNGAELPPTKAVELDGALFPDPGDHFAASQPLESNIELVGPVARR